MKRTILIAVMLIAAFASKATVYYDRYPLSASLVTNAFGSRIDCFVYDSSLAAVQTFSSDYYHIVNSMTASYGMMIFSAVDSSEGFAGCAIYDFEIHQWKTFIIPCGLDTNPYTVFTPEYVYVHHLYYMGAHKQYFAYGYYDLALHDWVFNENIADGTEPQVALQENIVEFSDGNSVDDVVKFFAFNPKDHAWTDLGLSVSPNPQTFIADGVAGCYMSFDPINNDPPALYLATLDPENSTTNALGFASYDITEYSMHTGIYCHRNNLNNQVEFGKYDAQLDMWRVNTFPSPDVDSWVSKDGVIAFKNNLNTMVISAVYDFDLHQWLFDSTVTTAVNNLMITEGTIKWNDGSANRQRGYNATTGWSNSSTLLKAVFYLSDLSSLATGNLVYAKNYSIGASNSFNYTFGDGKGSSEKNVFHLYKSSGSYMYGGSSPSFNVCLTVQNSSGSNTTCHSVGCPSPVASVSASGTINFCSGDSVVLSAITVSGYSYQWMQNSSIIAGATNSTFTTTTTGAYYCMVNSACGNSTSNIITVTVSTPPVATITASGATTICAGGSVTLSAPAVPGATYAWKLNGNNLNGHVLPSYSATAAGSYTCVITNFCGNFTSNSIIVIVNTGAVSAINNLSGPTYMCPGNTYNYSVTNISNATFNWTAPANASITGQGTNAITVTPQPGFTAGSVCVNATNGCTTSLTKCKGVASSVPARPTSIAGALYGVCATTQSYTCSAVAGATGYSWVVTGGSILSGQSTQTISVQWNGTGASGSLNVVAVNGCGSSLVRSVATTLNPAVASAISGSSFVCAGSTNNIFSVPPAVGASSYSWQITPAGSTIVTGQGTTSINATWGTLSGIVLCTPVNACGSSKTKTFAVNVPCRMGNDDIYMPTPIELIAYPNPFNDKINIELNSNDDAAVKIKVSDVIGRIISEHVVNANSVYTLGENMSNGIYFVEARQKDRLKTIRVVKNN